MNTETLVIPTIDKINNTFDNDDFLLLPHGCQSHRIFDTSIPEGVVFDTTLERSIYYNQFDGFTSRSNKGLENTLRYFDRLGISEFVSGQTVGNDIWVALVWCTAITIVAYIFAMRIYKRI